MLLTMILTLDLPAQDGTLLLQLLLPTLVTLQLMEAPTCGWETIRLLQEL